MLWNHLCFCFNLWIPLVFGGPLSDEHFLYGDMVMDQITQEGNRLAFDSIEQDIDALPPSIQPTLSSKPEEFWSPSKTKSNKSKALQYLVHKALMQQRSTNIDHPIKFSPHHTETTSMEDFFNSPKPFVRLRTGLKTDSNADLDRISRKAEEVPKETTISTTAAAAAAATTTKTTKTTTTTTTLIPLSSIEGTSTASDDMDEDVPSFFEDQNLQNASNVKGRVINLKVINHGKQIMYIF